MIKTTRFAAAAWLLALSPALAEPLDDHILSQLACQRSPDATYALLSLDHAGRIDNATAMMMDSATCWPIKPELDLAGMSFSDICASAEDPLVIELLPDFYYRGPGTSAGTGLALVTHASLEDASAWASTNLAGDKPLYTVDQSYRVEGGVEIACNSLSFLP